MRYKDLLRMTKTKRQPDKISIDGMVFNWVESLGDYINLEHNVRLSKVVNSTTLLDLEFEIVGD